MHEYELRQRHYQAEQLLDTKLSIITFLNEMVAHVEFDISHLIQEQHKLKRLMTQAAREIS